jgi:transcriptional regulator with XRE-family HTH domain
MSGELLPDGQLELLPDTISDRMLVESEYHQGIYSGKHLRRSDPAKYELVCGLLADGSLSQRQISRLTGCSRNLVSAISRNANDIEPHKQRLAARARNLAQLCLERSEEIIQSGCKLSLRDLAIMAGVAIDKSQLLSGEATQIVGNLQPSGPTHEEFADYLSGLRQADAESLPPTGSGRENLPANGGDAEGLDGPDDDGSLLSQQGDYVDYQ